MIIIFILEDLKIDSSISDEKLVELIVKTKSSELFSIIYDRYSHLVYNKCISFVQNKEEAQDLTHDIFVKLFIKIKTFGHKSKFSTWLYSFTYNHCINYVQRDFNKRKSKFLYADTHEEHLSTVQNNINEEKIHSMDSEKLNKALDLIDPNDKTILFMKYQDDMKIEDIQEVLELGKSAVKMRLSRAKSRLVKVYETI
ncbi:RNA polymerase sigma factor [Hanstruepera marina]|uniref:RNA polymerase sigma factor n=1 Tax=Hanstruepera marina TaxID=2873265 RepID=UPI001CA71748|nr:sigma-70 family RNA polymerase sigma factor [Hanstruepera marina]